MSRKITAASHVPAEQFRVFQAGTLPEKHIAQVEAHLQIFAACCDPHWLFSTHTMWVRYRIAKGHERKGTLIERLLHRGIMETSPFEVLMRGYPFQKLRR